MTAPHPLAGVPVEDWMLRRIRLQSQLLMQIALNTPASDKPATQPVNTQRKVA